MRSLALLAAMLLLAACGSIDLADHHGLDPPPAGSVIPAPHGTWMDGPSVGGWGHPDKP